MEGQNIEWEDSSDEEHQETQKEEFFTYGIDELRQARKQILNFSIENCKNRLKNQSNELNVAFSHRKKLRHEWYSGLQVFYC